MVDAGVSKTPVRKDVRVRLPPRVLDQTAEETQVESQPAKAELEAGERIISFSQWFCALLDGSRT